MEGDLGWLVPQGSPKNACYKYLRDTLGERQDPFEYIIMFQSTIFVFYSFGVLS
jgi:hypothetical protein